MTDNELNASTLETWLWDSACGIRGEIDAPKCKEYITTDISEETIRCI